MKEEEAMKNKRKTFDSFSGSALLLSVMCCIALIHVEFRIQEHHLLISHSVTFCDQMESKILRKVQKNYEKRQAITARNFKNCCYENGEEQFRQVKEVL